MKRTIRLTESELRGMIQESVRRAIKESFETISDDEFSSLNMNDKFHPHDKYDPISSSAYWEADADENAPSSINIEVLKPFRYNIGSGSGSFRTSPSGEVIILLNQTIELSVEQREEFSKNKTYYIGNAKCSHRITRFSHGRDTEMNKGIGYTKLIIKGSKALEKGQKEGFIRIV